MVDAKSGDLLYGITMNFQWGKNSLSAVFFVPFFLQLYSRKWLFSEVEGERIGKIMTYEELKE